MGRIPRVPQPADGATIIAAQADRLRQVEHEVASAGGGGGAILAGGRYEAVAAIIGPGTGVTRTSSSSFLKATVVLVPISATEAVPTVTLAMRWHGFITRSAASTYDSLLGSATLPAASLPLNITIPTFAQNQNKVRESVAIIGNNGLSGEGEVVFQSVLEGDGDNRVDLRLYYAFPPDMFAQDPVLPLDIAAQVTYTLAPVPFTATVEAGGGAALPRVWTNTKTGLNPGEADWTSPHFSLAANSELSWQSRVQEGVTAGAADNAGSLVFEMEALLYFTVNSPTAGSIQTLTLGNLVIPDPHRTLLRRHHAAVQVRAPTAGGSNTLVPGRLTLEGVSGTVTLTLEFAAPDAPLAAVGNYEAVGSLVATTASHSPIPA